MARKKQLTKEEMITEIERLRILLQHQKSRIKAIASRLDDTPDTDNDVANIRDVTREACETKLQIMDLENRLKCLELGIL